MNKLCCGDLEPPSISVKVSCPSSCCESRLDEKDGVDVTVMPSAPPSPEKKTVCCCFPMKRLAKDERGKSSSKQGREETPLNLL